MSREQLPGLETNPGGACLKKVGELVQRTNIALEEFPLDAGDLCIGGFRLTSGCLRALTPTCQFAICLSFLLPC